MGFSRYQQTRLQTQHFYFKSNIANQLTIYYRGQGAKLCATVKLIRQVARVRIERGFPDNSNGKTYDGAGSEDKKKTVNDDNKIMVKINNNPITLWGFPRIMRKKFKYQHKTVKIANW